jgi:hypothetical protein
MGMCMLVIIGGILVVSFVLTISRPPSSFSQTPEHRTGSAGGYFFGGRWLWISMWPHKFYQGVWLFPLESLGIGFSCPSRYRKRLVGIDVFAQAMSCYALLDRAKHRT